MLFELKVVAPFTDMEHPDLKVRKEGEIFEVKSPERVKTLMGHNKRRKNFVEIIRTTKDATFKSEGPVILLHQNYMYHIGGIETFIYNLVKNYADRNITLLVDHAELEPVLQIGKYCNIQFVQPKDRFEGDVLILGNYNSAPILHQVKVKKVYQMIHGDFEALRRIPDWANFVWEPDPRIDKIIAVSESAALGLKNSFNLDSHVIYNILDKDLNIENNDHKVFITLSRATKEKGIHRIVAMAKAFKQAGKHFIWLLCTSQEQIPNDLMRVLKGIPEIVFVAPDANNKNFIRNCDYLVQLSDTESFCYSAYEALQQNVPVILTDFPEARKIVDEGENGYIIKPDLSNLDVDKIFNHKPTYTYYIDRCNTNEWEKVFKGVL